MSVHGYFCNKSKVLNGIIRESQIPERYFEANTKNYYPVDDYHAQMMSYINNIDANMSKGINVVLYGSYGSGKTYIGVCILKEYILTHRNDDVLEPSGLYISHSDFCDRVRNYKIDSVEYLNQIMNIPLLMLDDIGAGLNNEETRSKTSMILGARYNKRKSTIITTNSLSMDIAMDVRSISRIQQGALIIHVEGGDRRL